jgi:hypothetical protein
MGRPKLILLLINVLGGVAVIGSYVLGLRGGSSADVLWGQVPESVRPVYAVSMAICVLGYFAFQTAILDAIVWATLSRT